MWRIAHMPRLRALRVLAMIVAGNIASVVKSLANYRRGDLIYVPYPSIVFLWLVSWLPSRIRPVCIADAYISIWDSAFNDRSTEETKDKGECIRLVEARALRCAAVVLVDTEANRDFYIENFKLDPGKVQSFPLAIDATPFASRRIRRGGDHKTRVVFVGTMIPLHGIATILDAAKLLSQRADIEFRLIGDGQMAPEIRCRIHSGDAGNVTWLRDWLPIDAIADEMANADICLGIFGGTEKSSRVLPFKLYYALAGGRPIITQAALSLPAGAPQPPVITVPPSCAGSLAEAIARLTSQPSERGRLADASVEYYEQWLSFQAIFEDWKELLFRIQQSTRPV